MRIGRKIYWLLLCVMVLTLILPSGMALAQEEKLDLILTLIPGDYYRKVTPGEETIFYLEIRNNGDNPITNVRLSSTVPEGWEVDFKPASVDYIGGKSFQTVDVKITPALDASRGEYQVNIIAETAGTRKVTSTWIRVETATSSWLWIGVVVALLVVAGFVIVYLRFGRETTNK